MQNLSYTTECGGTPVLDQSSTQENVNDFIPIVISNAYAQKFTPTSRCLDSVILKIRKVLDVNATVTICSDIGGFPTFPSSELGSFTRLNTDLSTTFTEITFPLSIVLPNLNPIWIVVTSMYDPNSTDISELIDIASISSPSGNNLAFKTKSNAWIYVANGKPVFKTFKLNYGTGTTTTTTPSSTTTTTPTPGTGNDKTMLYVIGGISLLGVAYLLTRKKK